MLIDPDGWLPGRRRTWLPQLLDAVAGYRMVTFRSTSGLSDTLTDESCTARMCAYHPRVARETPCFDSWSGTKDGERACDGLVVQGEGPARPGDDEAECRPVSDLFDGRAQ